MIIAEAKWVKVIISQMVSFVMIVTMINIKMALLHGLKKTKILAKMLIIMGFVTIVEKVENTGIVLVGKSQS
ncbi:hypothetical protein CHI08_26170 [Peribacillus simplex]|nr:hypothetical protein CHI08_26170 [Peribacillus simplex]